MGKVIPMPVGDSLLRKLFDQKESKGLDLEKIADQLLSQIKESQECPIEDIVIQEAEMFYTNQKRCTIVLPSGMAIFIRVEKGQIRFYLSKGAGGFDSELYNKILEGNARSAIDTDGQFVDFFTKKNKEFLYHKGGMKKLVLNVNNDVFQTCWIGPISSEELINLANQA